MRLVFDARFRPLFLSFFDHRLRFFLLRFGEPLGVVLEVGLFATGLPDEFFDVAFAAWPVFLEVVLDPPLADEPSPEEIALVVLALVVLALLPEL